MRADTRPDRTPELPSDAANAPQAHPAPSRLQRLTRAMLAGLVLAPPIHSCGTSPKPQMEGRLSQRVRDFHTLPDETVLLDLHTEGFVSTPVRIRSLNPAYPGHVIAFLAPARSAKESGPLLRVDGGTYSITNDDPFSAGKRASLHVSRVIRHDADTMRIESDTRFLRGARAFITVTDIAGGCDKIAEGEQRITLWIGPEGNRSSSITLQLRQEDGH